ncbi:MAG: hypothetical protein AB7U49_04585 [Hyphomicrobiaceae bacterium]
MRVSSVMCIALAVGGPTLPAQAAEPTGSSVLTAAEAGLNCRKMAGRMQIRLMELRGGDARPKQSGAAQLIQRSAVPIFGGTQRGADAAADEARDVAKLRAMNDLLKSRKCAYYDIDAELARAPGAPPPALIRPSAAKTKKKH